MSIIQLNRSTLLKFAALLVLMLAVLPSVRPAHAATAAVGQFYAGCSDFSVDVAVSGYTNDGNNRDRFWYQITDGNGKKLYTEYAERNVGETAGSMVVNLSYDAEGIADGAPTKNPIHFQVIDLDSNNNLGAELASTYYDAPCLDGTGHSTAVFQPPKRLVGTITSITQLFQQPNSGGIGLYAQPGAQHSVFYRNADGSWVSIFVGGNNTVWIPAGAIAVDVSQVAAVPTHIDRSSLDPTPGFVPAANPGTASGPTGITATVTAGALNMRATADYRSAIVTTLTYNTTVAVLGRNAGSTYLKVDFNGTQGWIAAYYVRLSGGRVRSLPIVN